MGDPNQMDPNQMGMDPNLQQPPQNAIAGF